MRILQQTSKVLLSPRATSVPKVRNITDGGHDFSASIFACNAGSCLGAKPKVVTMKQGCIAIRNSSHIYSPHGDRDIVVVLAKKVKLPSEN